MKWLLFILSVVVVACNKTAAPIDGSYILTAATYGDSILSKAAIAKNKTMKICRNGYWITVTWFGTAKTTVESASGGTYTLSGNKCTETLHFFSKNDSLVGNICTYTYGLSGDTYTCEGIISNDICGKCRVRETYHKITSGEPPGDTSLEGAWKLQSSEWYGKKVVDTDFNQIKIYSYPNTIWASFHARGKDFIGTGGGTYQIDGNKLVEYVEFFSFYDNVPFYHPINVTKLPSGIMQQFTPDGEGKEIWKKIQ